MCAPMENCYSNLMNEDEKGILSLILSLIGLKVNVPGLVCRRCVKTEIRAITDLSFPDHHLAAAGEGLPVRDAAVRAAGASLCEAQSVGRGAAVCLPPAGETAHYSDVQFGG